MTLVCPSLLTIFSSTPRRYPNDSITLPIQSSGASILTSSYGSQSTPSISLIITFGLETWSSYPSRRIFSINIDKCNSPRPETIHSSLLGILSIFKDTSRLVSLNKRSSIWRAVTNFPSWPANGEVLVPKTIWIVGSSTFNNGKASSFPVVHTVSPTPISAKPAIATISPAPASSISIRCKPIKPNNFWILNWLCEPSARTQVTLSLTRILPRWIRPTPILPT